MSSLILSINFSLFPARNPVQHLMLCHPACYHSAPKSPKNTALLGKKSCATVKKLRYMSSHTFCDSAARPNCATKFRDKIAGVTSVLGLKT